MTASVLAKMRVDIDAQFGEFKSQLDRIEAETRRATAKVASATEVAEKAFGRVRAAITGVAVGVAALGAAAVTRSLSGLPEAAANAERQFARLQGVIDATGGAAGRSVADIERLAREIGETTLASTQNVRDAAAQLLTFKAVTEDTFDTALRLSQDLAEAGFGGLEENAKRLGRALEDPVRGMAALRESGVSFTAAQQEQIKALVKSNDLIAAQGMIIDAVAGQVGGVGVKAAQGYAGAVDTAGERLKIFREELGLRTLPALTAVQVAIGDTAKYLTDNLDDALSVAGVALTGIGTTITVALLPALAKATVAIGAFTLALATNPLFLAATALGALAAAYVALSDDADPAAEATRDLTAAQEKATELQGKLKKATEEASGATRALSGDAATAAEALGLETRAAEATATALKAVVDLRKLSAESARLEATIGRLPVTEAEESAIIGGSAAADNATAAYADLTAQLETVAQKTADYEMIIRAATGASENLTAEANDLRASLAGGSGSGGGGGGGSGGGVKGAVIDLRNETGTLVDKMDLATVRFRDGKTAADLLSPSLEKAAKEQRRLAEEVRQFEAQPFLNALEDIQRTLTDVFADAFRGSIRSLEDFADSFLDIVARLGANLLSQRLVIPIVASAGGAFGLSPQDLGIPAGASGSGGLGDLSSIFSGGGDFSSVGKFLGSGLGLGDKVGSLFNFGVGPTGPIPLSGAQDFLVGGLNNFSSIGGGFGAIAGNLLGDALFGKGRSNGQSANASIGSSVGALAGSFIPIPVVGTLLGALAGNFIGGQFGPKPSNRLQTARSVDRGELILEGQTGGKFDQGNLDFATEIATSANSFLLALETATKATSDFSTVTGLAGDRSGDLLDFFRDDPGRGLGVTGDLRFEVDDELDLLRATLEAFLVSAEDLDGVLRDRLTVALDGTQEELLGTVEAVGIFTDVAARLKALDPAEPVSSLEQAFNALNDPLDAAREKLVEYGLSIADLNELQDRLNADLADGFIAGLEQANRAIKGEGFKDAILGQVQAFQDVFASADFLGRGGEIVAENLRLSLEDAFGQLSTDQLGGLADFLAAASDGTEAFAVALAAVADVIADREAVAQAEALAQAEADRAAAAEESARRIAEAEAKLADERLRQAQIVPRFADIFGEASLGQLAGASGLPTIFGEQIEELAAGILPATAAAKALGERILGLGLDADDTTRILDLVSEALARNAASVETVTETVEDVTDATDQAAIAIDALADRLAALASFEEAVIARTEGEDAARAFRLAGAGLGSLVDDLDALSRSGSLGAAQDQLRAIFDAVRGGGFSANQVSTAQQEAIALFDALAFEATDAAATVARQIEGAVATIREGFGGLFADINVTVIGLVDGLRDSAARTSEAIGRVYAARLREIDERRARFEQAAGAAGEILTSLALEGSNPGSRLDAIRAEFDATAGRAATGDLGAVQSLQSIVPQFLDAVGTQFVRGTPEFFEAVAEAQDAARVAQEAAIEQADRAAAQANRVAAESSRIQDEIRRLTERQVAEAQAAAQAQIASLAALRDQLIAEARADREVLIRILGQLAENGRLEAQTVTQLRNIVDAA